MHVMLSYPKSGRTWIRFMVDSYLCRLFDLDCPNVFDAEKQLKQVHPIEWTHLTGAMIARLPYWAMGPWNLDDAAKQIPWLVLTRNFQATLASAYFQARDRVKVFQGTPSQFVRDPRYGVIKLVSFYNQFEELRPSLKTCHVFSYERFLREPKPQLRRLIEALGLRVDEPLIDRVVEESDFENMKRLSIAPEYAGSVIAPTDPTRPETFKIRSAGRDKKEVFNADDIAYIDRVIDDLFFHRDNTDYQECLGRPAPKKTARETAQA
jgi:sulfotransferase family protein